MAWLPLELGEHDTTRLFRISQIRPYKIGKQGFWGLRSVNLLGTTIPSPLKHAHFVSRLYVSMLLFLMVTKFSVWRFGFSSRMR